MPCSTSAIWPTVYHCTDDSHYHTNWSHWALVIWYTNWFNPLMTRTIKPAVPITLQQFTANHIAAISIPPVCALGLGAWTHLDYSCTQWPSIPWWHRPLHPLCHCSTQPWAGICWDLSISDATFIQDGRHYTGHQAGTLLGFTTRPLLAGGS